MSRHRPIDAPAHVVPLIEAAALARPGTRVFLGGALADPVALLDVVAGQPALWRDVTITGAFVPGVNRRDYAALGSGTRVEAILATPELVASGGRVDWLPLHYSQFEKRLGEPGFVDIAYFATPPPRSDGTIGLGPAVDFLPALAAAGASLVAVVNRNLPDVVDGPRLPVARFAALTSGDTELAAFPTTQTDPVSETIAGHVAAQIGDGETLELGLGKLQEAILAALRDRRDLAFHAGMISSAVLPLLEAGVFSRGVTTGLAIGPADFLHAVAARLDVNFSPVCRTHGIATLAGIERFVAVNSVIEVDLWGQANAERAGGRRVGGLGGLVDFMRGARASRGGRSILALPATARAGAVSRIVSCLDGPVSVARADVDLVITEFGTADLRGASETERASRIAAIAAPAFRDNLLSDWRNPSRR